MNLPIIGFIEMWMVVLAVVIFFWATSALKNNRNSGKHSNGSPSGMTTCPRPGCGCQNPDRARFCRNCGIALSAERSIGGDSSGSRRPN